MSIDLNFKVDNYLIPGTPELQSALFVVKDTSWIKKIPGYL